MLMRTPDFTHNLLPILKGGRAERATIFELFLNDDFYARLAGHGPVDDTDVGRMRMVIDGMAKAGYDYATCHASAFSFPKLSARAASSTVSLNGQSTIWDRESYETYVWPDPASFDDTLPERVRPYLPEGMKLMVMGPGGVLENVIDLVGYDELCYMLFDDPDLVAEIFEQVGSRLLKYYELIAQMDTVGFLCSNDDWGFNSQTFLSPDDMRRYVFPWHKKIVETAHKAEKPCILHSCGRFDEVIEDVIEDMHFDGRHSYEDKIMPVEEAYEVLHGRIVVMGGIDMDFLVRSNPHAVYSRSMAMLERTADRGGYLLGSGNSIPTYVPFENYTAMIRAAWDFGA